MSQYDQMAYALDYHRMYDITGLNVAVTGGAGILCSEMAKALGALGANVAILDIDENGAQNVAAEVSGGKALAAACDVLELPSLERALATVEAQFGPTDVLINGAGGNRPSATTGGTTVAEQIEALAGQLASGKENQKVSTFEHRFLPLSKTGRKDPQIDKIIRDAKARLTGQDTR